MLRVCRSLSQQRGVPVSNDHLCQVDVILAVTDAVDRLHAVTRARQFAAVTQQVRLLAAKYRLKPLHVCSKIRSVLPARRIALAGNSRRIVSVWLSVCLSVCHSRYCIKTETASVMISSPSDSPLI